MEYLKVFTDGTTYVVYWRGRIAILTEKPKIVPALLKIYGSYGKIGALVRVVEYSFPTAYVTILSDGGTAIDNSLVNMVKFLRKL
jgi:hypothetical protein